MLDYWTFQKAHSMTSSLLHATGNKEIEKLQEILQQCERLHKAATEVAKFFPNSGDSYYSNNPKSLEEKIKLRLNATKEFLSVVDSLNRKEAI